MDKVNYGNNRWCIVYGTYDQAEKRAVDHIYGLVSKYVPYVLTVNCHSEMSNERLQDLNPIFIGTPESNGFIDYFIKEAIISIPQKEESYSITVTQNPFNPNKQAIIIAGYDCNGVLYGCMDFENVYISTRFYTNQHMPTYFIKPFSDKMPVFEQKSSPSFKNRGLWTWGHVIYDYKKYLDNMALLKMNLITIWNDYAPINAKDVVDYAHSLGIKVIWGYTWGWGETFSIADESNLEKWSKAALEIYEKQYADLGGDGIYFQTFTETTKDSIDGVSIAETVVKWVNAIGGKMLELHPELDIQFGLHATSVKHGMEYIKNIDPRISIVWEDCGAFPYSYVPQDITRFEETDVFCEKICTLRGENEKFGAVLKGLVCLDWSVFEHQKGSFILGNGKCCNDERRKTIEEIWRYVQAYWIRNADKAYEMLKTMQVSTAGNAVITALVEDALFEEQITYPVAVLASMLWDTEGDISDILCNAALMTKTTFK